MKSEERSTLFFLTSFPESLDSFSRINVSKDLSTPALSRSCLTFVIFCCSNRRCLGVRVILIACMLQGLLVRRKLTVLVACAGDIRCRRGTLLHRRELVLFYSEVNIGWL